ncbi:lipopolysaccharide biosynthesis protein [Psychromonas sp. 14N.309.X.WAT.B.A12]|uniref:lipopolysaccharide biosynthesis protein n=1 Tax=Psychromonas sp. 14N.309.X.WAT.B.A12 TaxID=2998322 RepID=UPI0025B0AE56|nr:lipopolysaccharide biosynthesis protein [Psychromonas sp. 14N.309.X.WAT.B.A12]MDN2664401.1 lipopolysaccharide biosynthesis protein [Psychromonas sp. 14N.309.X.WAT.B.A12]
MLEKRFNEFKDSIKPAEFNNIEFLQKKAESLKATDPELSDRILIRVKKLKSQVKKQEKSKQNAPVQKMKVTAKPQSKRDKLKRSPFLVFVVLPTLIFAAYQLLWATERYESQAKVIVQQPDSASTMDSSMALLTGLTGSSGGNDAELVKAYIYSNDMIEYLNNKIALREHYSQSNIDFFSRIHGDDSKETLNQYYQEHVDVVLDDASGVITIAAQGFDSEYAQLLTNTIVERAEWFINSIGHQLANAQLSFMQGEHKRIEERFTAAQKDLLVFQQKYNLLDPTAEGTAKQTITNTIESQIATKQTEIKTLKAIMSDSSPQVQGLKNELSALNAQLEVERDKLSQTGLDEVPVSELLSRFTDYKIKMDLALQAYTSSQISLEKSRIEAYRQLKYLITVEKATLSEDSKYPDVIYNISLFLLLLSLAFGIGKIIISTIKELK